MSVSRQCRPVCRAIIKYQPNLKPKPGKSLAQILRALEKTHPELLQCARRLVRRSWL